jgi:hypothetical protein
MPEVRIIIVRRVRGTFIILKNVFQSAATTIFSQEKRDEKGNAGA